MSEKRLMRSTSDRMFMGVAGGLAEYLDLDPTLVRLVFVILGLASFGHAILIYLVLALLMPEAKRQAKANAFDEDEIVIRTD